MTLLRPSALSLLALALVVALLYFLRSRERRRDVSALFLWEGLRGDPRSAAARIRRRIDLPLLLQLAALAAVALALAEPAWRRDTTTLNGLVVIVDGSASMRGMAPDGATRYRAAVDRAIEAIERHPAQAVGIIQFSARPSVLVSPAAPSPDPLDPLRRSEPTWYGDGEPEHLRVILESFGGTTRFDRILMFTDQAWDDLPPEIEVEQIPSAPNRGITRFAVRENPTEPGATAFVEVRNDSDDLQSVRIRIRDEANETALTVLLAPREVERYLIPFPGSRGNRFTAALEPADGFPADDVRYFALERPRELRVRWVGAPNRYLLAALRAAAPVLLTETDPDMTVVYAATVPKDATGDLLLVRSSASGIARLGDRRSVTGPVSAPVANHPLLRGVDPSVLRVRAVASLIEERPGTTILSVEGLPLLAEYPGPDRTVLLFAADLMETNLPITVDFPILIANWVGESIRRPSLSDHRWADIGDAVDITGRGTPLAVVEPNGSRILLPDGSASIRPTEPGHYAVETDRGTFSIGANVPAAESFVESNAADRRRAAPEGTVTSLLRLSPLLAAAGAVALVAEALAYWGGARRRRRKGSL